MKGNKYNHKLPNIDILKYLYFDKKMSSRNIANKYNVTTGAVLIKFRRYNIKRRSLSDSQKLKANYIELNNELIDFINGLLLGDGSVVYSPNKKSCAYAHTDKNKGYLIWLKTQLKSLGIQCAKINSHPNNAWQFRTKYYRNFVTIREIWYPDNKKKIPLIKLFPIVLFNWYIGDGSYDKKSKSEKVVICSEFDQTGKMELAKQMELIGIKNTVYKKCIYIKKESRNLFFDYIKNHSYSIPECYKYKF